MFLVIMTYMLYNYFWLSKTFYFLPFMLHKGEATFGVATHSSTLAWRIPGMEEPDGLPSMCHTESDTTDST